MDSSKQNSLQQRHLGFATPRKIIFQLVKKATGENAQERKKIIKGYDSEVYEVKTQRDREYIVKIKRYGGVSYQQEAWVLSKCAEQKVPVAEVLLLDKIELKNGKQHEVIVQNKLTGRALADVRDNLTFVQINKVLQEAGHVLSRIHSIKVKGFYRRHEDGVWDFPRWEVYIERMVKGRTAEKPLLLKAGITEDEFEVLVSALREYRDNFDCRQPVLCHGDFLPEHIFIDDDLNITGVLDFGDYEGNHPVHDFAFIDFEAPNLNLEAIKEGYRNKIIFDDKFGRRLLLHKIALQMGHLAHHTKEGMRVEAEFNYKRLKDSLKELQRGKL